MGLAANYAAKLTGRKGQRTWITKPIYDASSENSKFGGTEKKSMWTNESWSERADATIYGSGWTWKV